MLPNCSRGFNYFSNKRPWQFLYAAVSQVFGKFTSEKSTETGFYLKHIKKCLARGFYLVVSFPLAVTKRIICFFKDIFAKLTRSNFDKVQFELIPLYSKCWYVAEIIIRQNPITFGLFLKANPGAHPLIWKLVFMQMN